MSLRVQFPSDQQAYDSVLGGDKGSLNPHPIFRIAADGLGKMHFARVARYISITFIRSIASCTEALVLFFSTKAKGTIESSLLLLVEQCSQYSNESSDIGYFFTCHHCNRFITDGIVVQNNRQSLYNLMLVEKASFSSFF